MTNGNDCAFTHPGVTGNHAEFGLTKREMFAAMAMQGLIATNEYMTADSLVVGDRALTFADGLITMLNAEAENK